MVFCVAFVVAFGVGISPGTGLSEGSVYVY